MTLTKFWSFYRSNFGHNHQHGHRYSGYCQCIDCYLLHMGGRLIFRGLHGCGPIRLYCHWSGKLANTLGDLDKYLFTLFGYESFTLSQFHTGLIFCKSFQITTLKSCITLKIQSLWLWKVIFFTFYTCEINKGDIWHQFEKLKKIARWRWHKEIFWNIFPSKSPWMKQK
jgi:hypothetical protein